MVSTLLKLLNISAVHIKSAECRQNGKSCFYGSPVKRKHANGSSIKRKHQTQALMGATRLASVFSAASFRGKMQCLYTINKYCFYITKFKYHLCYYLNLFAILAKGTVR